MNQNVSNHLNKMSPTGKKFIDRTPLILPAGRVWDDSENSVKNCLKIYTLDDAKSCLETVSTPAQKPKDFEEKQFGGAQQKGIFTDIRPSLRPGEESRYQTLINELKETSYESHWSKRLGKGRDATPGLPKGYNALERTCGKASNKQESVKDLMKAPPSQQIEDKLQVRKKAFHSYDIGERIFRNYNSSFDCNKKFGMKTSYDPRGKWLKCCSTWLQGDPIVFNSDIQSRYANKVRSYLGKSYGENEVLKNFVHGKSSSRPLYNVSELLKDPKCALNRSKHNIMCWMIYFNYIKRHIKNRLRLDFTLDDLYNALLFYDNDKCSTVSLQSFYEVCACFRLSFDRDKLEPFLRWLGVICDDRINYRKFLEMLDANAEPVDLPKIDDIPDENKYYLTTNQAAQCDRLVIDNAQSKAAGIPAVRRDLDHPTVAENGCRADLDNLGDDCSADIALNPSIYFNYGLSFRDFRIPRQRHVVKALFENAGYRIDDEVFGKLWCDGIECDRTGFVCIETFQRLLEKYLSERKKVVVDEVACQ